MSRDFVEIVKKISGSTDKVAVERALHRIGMLLEAKIKAQIVKIGLVDYGHLLNSIRYSVKMDASSGGGTVVVGTYGVVYAKIHEFGGTIYPVRARALTIPVSPWAKGRRAADFRLIRIKNLLVDPSRLGNSDRIPQDAIAFRLVKKAEIREKAYMRTAIKESSPNIVSILRSLEEP